MTSRTSEPNKFGGSGVNRARFNNVELQVNAVNPLLKALLLFAMNWLDAQLTVIWVRLNVATEGNGLMAALLKQGDLPFIAVKLLVGGFAAVVLYRCSRFPIARRGMTLVLAVYGVLMLVHAATGCAALGWLGPIHVVEYIDKLPGTFLALFS